jgi:ubiquinone/menaquinone biosynthesis C-methylase UbiE
VTEPAIAAETYARWRTTVLGSVTESVEASVVFGLAGPLQGQRVLDVGTGDGTYAIEAAVRGAKVTGLDIKADMLDAMRARASARGVDVVLRQGNAEALPFDDASFDVVTAVTVLCFVANARLAVREMARVLVPGGRLVLGELGRFSVWAAERRVRGWLGSSTWRRARFWSRSELPELPRSAGCTVSKVQGAVFFPPSNFAARALGPFDPFLTRLNVPGAAFLTLLAEKRVSS